MSDQLNAVSLLDGLILGEPISDHHGVRCCPAIRENSDDRYIVKIISLPASQSHMDALMLTGACADEAQALSYFGELAQGICDEAALMQKLSNLEGFVSYPRYEIREMPHAHGYQVFLLSHYKPSLAKLMQESPLNHLAAVNLGLDLCAALAACRRMGYLYVDLRPENIFFCDTQGYRIGDLGFISMNSMRFASLPERYRSIYTAPEVTDALSSLSDTMDIYALGLTLYQVFNNGQLPFDNVAPAKSLPAPLYADYEMAAIILKACAPDPKDRWSDPAQMGQALVDYMQRNSVNATPIIPAPVILDQLPEEEDAFLSEEENDAQLADLLAQLPEELPPEQLAMDGSSQPLTVEEEPDAATCPSEIPEESDQDQLSFLNQLTNDETAPSEEDILSLDGTEVSEELADFFAQIDDLISHELPQPVVAPGPIEVTIPDPIVEEPEPILPQEADLFADTEDEPVPAEAEDADEIEDEEAAAPAYDTEDAVLYDRPVRRRPGRWIGAIIALVLFLGAAIGGYIWYQNYFLISVDQLLITGDDDHLTVSIVANVDEKKLSVVCTDTYGNTMRVPVVGGVANFTDLNSATQYRIRVEVSGLHKLTGNTTGIYTTQEQSQILNFTAICGPEDGSVILSFSVNGPDSQRWSVAYSTAGEETRKQEFTGHSVTIFNLTPGSEYTFTLEGDGQNPLTGETALVWTAQRILYAEGLQVTACGGGSLTVQWNQPQAAQGQIWLLRCYNDAGYDQTVSTTEQSYTFTGLDHSTGYTILVTADGMTQSATASVTANPINVNRYSATLIAPYALEINWDFVGEAPTNGWILAYTINGSQEILLPCTSNNALLALVSGGHYEFTARPADDLTCFTLSGNFTAEENQPFEGFGLTTQNITTQLVLRPEKEDWGFLDLTDDSYRSTFTAEEAISILLTANSNYILSDESVEMVFAIRDEAAQLVSAEQLTTSWSDLWTGSYCALDLPLVPDLPGNYMLDLYFNGLVVATLSFTLI